MTLIVLARKPGLAGAIEHILCAQDIRLQEEARIGDTAVHMALGCKVDDIVNIIFPHDFLHQLAVANIAPDEGNVGALQLALDGSQVTGIGQGIEDNDLDVVAILTQNILHKV